MAQPLNDALLAIIVDYSAQYMEVLTFMTSIIKNKKKIKNKKTINKIPFHGLTIAL
jgi:hypothetical protein